MDRVSQQRERAEGKSSDDLNDEQHRVRARRNREIARRRPIVRIVVVVVGHNHSEADALDRLRRV